LFGCHQDRRPRAIGASSQHTPRRYTSRNLGPAHVNPISPSLAGICRLAAPGLDNRYGSLAVASGLPTTPQFVTTATRTSSSNLAETERYVTIQTCRQHALRRPGLPERRRAATEVPWYLLWPDLHRLVIVSFQDARPNTTSALRAQSRRRRQQPSTALELAIDQALKCAGLRT